MPGCSCCIPRPSIPSMVKVLAKGKRAAAPPCCCTGPTTPDSCNKNGPKSPFVSVPLAACGSCCEDVGLQPGSCCSPSTAAGTAGTATRPSGAHCPDDDDSSCHVSSYVCAARDTSAPPGGGGRKRTRRKRVPRQQNAASPHGKAGSTHCDVEATLAAGGVDSCSSQGSAVECDSTDRGWPHWSSARWWIAALVMAIFTIVYNVAEGVSAIYLGVESESVSLLGFGIDSLVEVASGCVVLVVLRATRRHEQAPVQTLRRATGLIGVLLCLLGASAMAGAVIRLVSRQPPLTTIPGIVISAASLSFMFALWLTKRRAAVELNSSVLAKDADCSLGCIQLSVALFVGSLVYYLTTEVYAVGPYYWWVDAVITVELARRIGYDGIQTLRAAARPDFDGTTACCS